MARTGRSHAVWLPIADDEALRRKQAAMGKLGHSGTPSGMWQPEVELRHEIVMRPP